jgi:N utilization substance protein B
MTRRSRSREVALQLLVQFDVNPRVDRAVIERFVRDRLRDPASEQFCLALYDGALAERPAIDRRIVEVAENWRLPRMAAVDRNVLRLAAHELMHTPETPTAVAINEAVELARRFGSKDSPAFVNGLLDRIAQPPGPTGETPPAAVVDAPPPAPAEPPPAPAEPPAAGEGP